MSSKPVGFSRSSAPLVNAGKCAEFRLSEVASDEARTKTCGGGQKNRRYFPAAFLKVAVMPIDERGSGTAARNPARGRGRHRTGRAGSARASLRRRRGDRGGSIWRAAASGR